MAQVFNHALLLKARLELNLTQEQAAAAAGVDVRTYRRYESGDVNDPREGFSVRHPTRRRMLERLSAELGIAEEDLLVDAPLAAPPPASPTALSMASLAMSPAASATIPAAPHEERPTSVPPPPDDSAAESSFRPLHLHTLQRARHFVGRDDILAHLTSWAAEAHPAHRVLALVAVGGTGKTAIVERFVASLGDIAHPFGVLVWSFYEDLRIESFLAHAGSYFAPNGEGAAIGEAPVGERFERLTAALRKGPPHLLVLDGLEAVQAEGGARRAHGELHDVLLRRLLCAIARGLGNTRALVTSRFELADLGAWEGGGLCTIRLGPLTEGEGAAMLHRWGMKGDTSILGALSARTGGHALSVAMIGSYVGAFLGGDPSRLDSDSLDLSDAARDDVLARRLSAVLSAYAQALPEGERDLLARMSVFPAGVSEDALLEIAGAGDEIAGSLAGWTRADLRRSLARLERLNLVFSAREGRLGYSTHPFLRQHFKSLLGVPVERIHAIERGRLASRLDTKPHGPPEDAALLDAFEALLVHMIGAGRLSEAYGIYSRSLGGFGHLGLRLGAMSRGARIVRAFADGDDPREIQARLPAAMRGALAYDWGLYAGALGDLAFACRCYELHHAIAGELGDAAGLATSLRTLAYTRRLRGDLLGARRDIEESIAIAEEACEDAHALRGIALFASILDDSGEVDAASAQLARLREMDPQPVARRGLWEAEHWLAIGRRVEARISTERNLYLCERLGWRGHVAHCNTLLGLIAVEEERLADARGHLERARAWAGAAGEVEAVLRCHDLAARIELTAGSLPDAEREIGEGIHTAVTCGFGLWRSRLEVLSHRLALGRDPSL